MFTRNTTNGVLPRMFGVEKELGEGGRTFMLLVRKKKTWSLKKESVCLFLYQRGTSSAGDGSLVDQKKGGSASFRKSSQQLDPVQSRISATGVKEGGGMWKDDAQKKRSNDVDRKRKWNSRQFSNSWVGFGKRDGVFGRQRRSSDRTGVEWPLTKVMVERKAM
jgi:hypothetical protein